MLGAPSPKKSTRLEKKSVFPRRARSALGTMETQTLSTWKGDLLFLPPELWLFPLSPRGESKGDDTPILPSFQLSPSSPSFCSFPPCNMSSAFLNSCQCFSHVTWARCYVKVPYYARVTSPMFMTKYVDLSTLRGLLQNEKSLLLLSFTFPKVCAKTFLKSAFCNVTESTESSQIHVPR